MKMEEKQNSVKQLRLLIQQEQGTPRFSQAPFLLPKSGKTEEASEFPLTDEQLLEGECSVVLCVQTAPSIKWGKWSKNMKIIAEDNLVVEKTADGYGLATGTVVVGGGDGVREGYFEVELTADSADNNMGGMLVGIVKTGLDHETSHFNTNNAWCLCADNGGLYGNDKFQDDKQGKLKVGDRVGVLVDLDGGEGDDGGSVRFFVNGSEYGSGFKSGVVGPVVLGVELFFKSQKLTILPEVEKPAGA